MSFISAGTLAKIALEVALGFSIKLFCENGRIHPADFVNDYLFWLPGVKSRDGDGLSRVIDARHPEPVAQPEPLPLPLAAK